MGLALGLLGLLSACTSPGSERIVGPNGSAMAHVHCGSEQGECFRIAGELCPSGYEMQPVLSGTDGNFLVRCRVAAARVGTAPCATPPPAVVTTTEPAVIARATPSSSHLAGSSAATTDRWPPATEPWPTTNPWPPPEKTSAAAHAPGKTPTTPTGDVDLGY